MSEPKPRKCGNYTRQRGYGYENELRKQFVGYGLECRRVPMSGAGWEKDDLVLTTGWGEVYRIECKRRKTLPAYLLNPTCHATIFRIDNAESQVLIPLSRFMELIQCR